MDLHFIDNLSVACITFMSSVACEKTERTWMRHWGAPVTNRAVIGSDNHASPARHQAITLRYVIYTCIHICMYDKVYNVWCYDKLGEIVSNQWTKDEINNYNIWKTYVYILNISPKLYFHRTNLDLFILFTNYRLITGGSRVLGVLSKRQI